MTDEAVLLGEGCMRLDASFDKVQIARYNVLE